ncbi:MAG: extracellular solute-binding protein [Spirochaetaceae bacterium]|nr:extracellular solute-binding protein [Spirochaetaceae bacterium]
MFIQPVNTNNLKKADFIFFTAGILVVAAAVVLVFLFKDGDILPPKRTTIVFAQWWESGMEQGSLDGIIADFEKNHPLIRVRLQNADWEDTRDGLLDTERESPDIIAVDTARLTEVATRGLLDVLPPDVLPSTANGEVAATADTERDQYHLRLVSFLHPLYYNIDILSAAGFSHPPRTREELLDYAKKTTDTAKGVYGTAFSRNTWTDILPWIWAGGVGVPIEEINWTSRPVIDTLAFLSALNQDKLVYPLPLSKREDELLDAFLAGNIVMFISSQAAATEIRAKKPSLSFSVTTIPQAAQPSGRNVFPVTEWALAIPAKGAHKEEALSLLRYLAERKDDVAAAAHGITGYHYEYAAADTDEDPIDQKLRALYEASDTAAVSTLGADAETLLNEVRVNLLALFNGEKTEAETAAAIQAAFASEQ